MSDYLSFDDIRKHKRLDVGLFGIKGIGKMESKKLYYKLGFNSYMMPEELDSEGEELLWTLIKGNYLLGDDLTKKINDDITSKGKIDCYQGLRHMQGLPVRGQRTKNNAKTAKKKNVFLLPKVRLLSRMSSKDRRREIRKDKREKKAEKKKK
jgi:small subunit ribosomal protein S13